MASIVDPPPDGKTEARNLVVTDEFFDYLLAEVERPAKPPTPAMVELLRATRGQIKHVEGDDR